MTNEAEIRNLEDDVEELKRDQRKLEARFVDLKSRFDGQGGTLAESARWVEQTMKDFDTRLEGTLHQYKNLLSNLSAFDFGMRLEQVEKLETRLTIGLKKIDKKVEELKMETVMAKQLEEGSKDG